MRILLTGSTGQVGHALETALANSSAFQPALSIIIPPREQMDLSKPDLVRNTIRQIQPDLIINPAAYTAVDRAESEPELAHLINGIAPSIMAEEAKRLGAALIHYSTDYVFDGSKQGSTGNLIPYQEIDQTNPINVYGASKLAGEEAIRQSGCRHLILRTSWVYSLFGKNFLLTMLRLAKERDELKIVNDQWGAPSSAPWIAQTTVDVLGQLNKATSSQAWWINHSGTYHLTPSGFTNWHGFTEEIIRLAVQHQLLGKPAPTVVGIPASEYPTPARRPVNSCLNTSLFASQFGVAIRPWQAVLADCLAQ